MKRQWPIHQQQKKLQQNPRLHHYPLPQNHSPNQPQPNLKTKIHTLQNHQTQYQIINTLAQLAKDLKKSAKNFLSSLCYTVQSGLYGCRISWDNVIAFEDVENGESKFSDFSIDDLQHCFSCEGKTSLATDWLRKEDYPIFMRSFAYFVL